jgi:hypothetical protein
MRKIIWILVIAGVAYWLYTHSGSEKTAPKASGSSSGRGSAGQQCLMSAGQANSELHSAAMLLLKPPVDQSAWRDAESRVSSAISSAESACSGGVDQGEKAAIEEARAALSTMRTLLGELSAGSRGGSGAGNAALRQEEIENRLDKARGLLR